MKLPDYKVVIVLGYPELYPTLPVSDSVFWFAIEVQKRCRESCWDSAIIASASERICRTVDSEDLNHRQAFTAIRVANPFI